MTINIPIIDDTTSESDETINLALTSPSTDANMGIQNNATLTILANDDNVAPTGLPTAILTGAVEDTSFSISEVDLLAGFSDANGDVLSIENLVATNGSIFAGNGYGNIDNVAAAQSLPAISTSERIFTFVPNANFNGIVNLTYGVTDGNFTLADQTLSFNVSPVNDAPTGTPTAVLANAELNTPYTINTSDLLAGFSDVEGDVLSIDNLTASSGSLVNNENGTYTFTPNTDFNGFVNLNYSVTDGTTPLTNQNININVGSVFSILPSISDEQIITSLLGNTTGLSNFQLTTSGSRQAVGFFQNDPFSFGQGIVLSTGSVSSLVGPRVGNVSTDLGNPGTVSGGRDAITLDITFDASTTSDQIFFQYIFGSEEFTEFSGSSFNDASTLILNGVNLARLTNGNTVTVNNLTPSGDPTTFSPDYINNNAAGSSAFSQIALDGFTRPLGFAGALIPGASNRLVITVQDISDGILDSAIFLKANTLGIEQLPGVVQFLAPSYSVDENDTTLATITIIRTGGNNAAASVQLNLSDGTATAPNDYLNEPITINFALGESIKTITVPIVDDTIVESNETINLTLSNASTGLTIGTQNTALLTILANDNIAPTGSPTALLTGATEDTAFLISAIDLLAGFSDVNGDTLSITSLSSSSGSIINNEDGSYTFNPDANFNGDVTLSYGVTDGLATLANQSLNFNVAAVNDAPTGTPITVLNDAVAGISYAFNDSDLLNGFSDVDGDTLSVVNLAATNGNLADNGNGIYRFTPNDGFTGIVNLTYDVTDGITVATNQSLSFNVVPGIVENNTPIGSPTGILPDTNEDTAVIINTVDLLTGFTDIDGDSLSIVNLVATNGLLVNNNNGTFTFTPEANFNGDVDLVYDVTDGVAALTEQTLSFNVLAINDAPTGSPTVVLADATEDETYLISASDLLTGFSDVDRATLNDEGRETLSVVNLLASNGTLENAGSNFIFTPDANFNGIVTLTYDVSDGIASVTNQTRSLNVVAVNDAPTGSPTAVLGTSENTPLTINASELLAGFSDVEEDTLSVVNLVATNGNLVDNGDGVYTFTPDADFVGVVSLTYDVTDGTDASINQSLTFNVTPEDNENNIPDGSPTGTLPNTNEDTDIVINTIDLLTGFSDLDGDTLSVVNLAATNGVLANNNNGTFTFTPEANFNGEVTLVYDVTDGVAALTEQTLSFNVLAINDAPTGSPTTVLPDATEDEAFVINASDLLTGFSDVDEDNLSVVNLVANNGTLENAGNDVFIFTPNANFNGTVTLTYDVSDGITSVINQTRSLNVVAVNDAPTGSPTAILSTNEDTPFTINVSELLAGFSDVDADTLSVVNLAASSGTLIENEDGSYGFTPDADFNGEVVLTYEVSDGTETLTEQNLSFNVVAVNDTPTGSPTGILADGTEDTAYTITTSNLLAGFSDIDGDTLAIANLTANDGTVIDNSDGTYTFAPNANFNGLVNLTYDVSDGTGAITGQTLSFNLLAVNDAPTGSPTGILADGTEDTTYTINASNLLTGFSDVDGDTLTVANLTANNGTLIDNSDGTYSFSPNANFNGLVNLTYDVSDGNETLTGQSTSFNVTAVNDIPTGSPTGILADGREDNAYTISTSDLLAGFSDIDGDTLAVANLTASNGTVIDNSDGTYTFTPNANFNGLVNLTYDVSDGTDTITGQTLSFNLLAVNDAPTGSPTATLLGATEDNDFTISASDLLVGFNDVDGDILSVVNLVTSTGTLIGNEDGNYTFTPNANFNGEVVLTYGVTDGIETLTGQSISFNVAAVNDAPTGSPTGVLIDSVEDTVVVINTSNLLAGFSDIDGDTLAVANLAASNGTLVNNNNGTYSFTPDLNFNGEVTLTYDVTDGTAAVTAQTLTFSVAAVNDAPTGSPTATLSEATEDTAFTISTSDLLEGFSDVDGDILSIANLVANNGTLTDNGNETYTFSPNANFNGAVTLTYDVTDGFETLTSQTLNFSVAAVNDAPTGSPTAILPAVAEDTVVTINVADLLAGFSDIEGDTLSIANLVTSNGTLTNNGGGIFSLNLGANFNGEVTLTYDVTDGSDSLTAQSLSFNITPVNDAPTGSPTATLPSTAEDSAIVINASDLLIGFSDVDGDNLSVINLVASNGALVNNNNGTYNFTPTANFNGIIDLTYDVTDGAITLTGQAQSFGVTPVNDAPTLQQLLEDQGAGQNQPFTFTIPGNTFADIDAGDTLTLSTTLANGNPLPSWLSFNPATQTFSGTPPQVNIGSLNIRVTATDSAGASVSDVFALDIGLNIVGNLQANNLVGSNGFDTISGLNGNDTIDGGRGADRLDGGNGNDRLIGGTGRDTLIGGTGNDTLDGGADDDSYEASGTQAEFDTFSDTGTTGSDTLVNIGSTALTLNGFSLTNGIEQINGNNQAILGNNNANVLNFSGVSLNNVLFIGGGTGDDSITGNSANNDLRGNNGDDTIDGGAGNDWLDGGSQNDSLLGAAGDDTIIGGSGNDNLDGGEGNDTYNVVGNQAEFDTFADSGTSGTDTISNLAGTALTLNGFALNNGIDVINGNNQAIIGNNNGNAFNFSAVTFNNVSFVSGGNGDDSIVGTALSDNLQGGAGNDTISGGAGADRLDGGSQNDSLLGGIGDDTLVGGTGNDTLDGGEGSDTYEVAITQAEFDFFTDTGASGNDTLRNTGNSSLTLNGFSITNGLEFVDGNNRSILGNNSNNDFNFSAVTLSNVLFVDGGNGNDFFVGSTASDNLRGGNGNDTIDGGNGADNLFGGAGNDSFIFNSSSTGIDTINDFTIGGDTLRISSAGFGGTGVVGAAGALAAARFTTGAAATTAAQRFIYNNASGSLFFDIDGNGSAAQVQIALLNSRPALNSSSFSVF